MHELISPDSAINRLATSQSGVSCKRTSVSHLVVKIQSVQMSLGSPNTLCLKSCNRWQCPDRSWERVLCCLRFSVCSSSDNGGGGGRSFSTLLLPRSLVSESTACVCRFRRLSFLLAPSLGRPVELCLEWRVSLMGLGLGS